MSLEHSPPAPAEDLLQAFAVNTMALDGVLIELAGAERAGVARVQARAHGLSLLEVDTTDLALRLAGERLPGLVQMHERLGRSLRLTLALKRRIETGWPRRGEADDRRAMARRQVERAVSARIRAEFDEPAERLRVLEERLWDPGLEAMLDSMPVEAVIAEIGRELTAVSGLVAEVKATFVKAPPLADAEPAFVGPPPLPAALAQGETETATAPRGWPAGMVNPPPHDYEPWRPEYEKTRRRGGKRPDD